jgi:glycosyltransferase involved in cell wall biosynthesis
MTSTAGVAMYLRNTLNAWPTDAGKRPIGYCTDRWKLPAKSVKLAKKSNPVNLLPLSQLLNVKPLLRRVPYTARRILQKLYRTSFSRTLRRGRFDAYFEPNHLIIPCDAPTVTTIHDLSVVEHHQYHPSDRIAHWETHLSKTMEQTTHWVTPSAFSKSRMIQLMGIDQASITVTPLAARNLPYPRPDQLDEFRAKAQLPKQFILHLGTLEPRKNLLTLLDAWQKWPKPLQDRCPLVLAGGLGWGNDAWWQGLAGHPVSDRVIATDRIDDQNAALLLSAATVVVASSHYEGFGLPILEAMACGTPVICSDIPPFHEVAGDAASFIAPTDSQAWADALEQLIEDPAALKKAGDMGLKRAGQFSWEQTALLHADVFKQIAPSQS